MTAVSSDNTSQKTEAQIAFEEFQQTRFYQWCDSILVGKYHWLILPLTGFVDAFVIVLPTEVVLAVYLIRDKTRSFIKHTLLVASFAAVGYGILAVIASFVGFGILDWFSYFVGEEVTTKVEGILTGYVFILAITAGVTSVFPMPATAFAIVVGLVGAPLGWFIAGAFVGKALRFGLFAWVAQRYGMHAFDYYMRNATWMSVVIVVLLGLYIYIK